MSKKAYRFIPTSLWNTSIIEAWLSDMAGKGLFLLNFGNDLAIFTKAQPREIQYKIDMYPSFTEEDFENKISQYKDNGFNYECSYENFHVFFAKKPYNNSEANSIIEGNSDILKPLLKEQITKKYFELSLFLFPIIMFSLLTYKMNTELFYTRFFVIVIFFAFLINFFIYILAELFTLNRLRKSILNGSSISNNGKWQGKYYITLITKSSMYIFLIIIFLSNILKIIFSY